MPPYIAPSKPSPSTASTFVLAWQFGAIGCCFVVMIRRNGRQSLVDAVSLCDLSEWKESFHIGTLVAAHTECGNFDKAVESQALAMEGYTEEQTQTWGFLLELYKSSQAYRQA